MCLDDSVLPTRVQEAAPANTDASELQQVVFETSIASSEVGCSRCLYVFGEIATEPVLKY